MKKAVVATLLVTLAMGLTACSSSNDKKMDPNMPGMDHSKMNMDNQNSNQKNSK